MTDEDTIKALREQVARLLRDNEILQARLDELRMVHQPGRRIFTGEPPITNWSDWDKRMRDAPAFTTGAAGQSRDGPDGPGF